MRKLRYVGLVIGVALLLLMLRCVRADADNALHALVPATITGTALLIASVREPYSRERRRMVAYCWIAAAAGSAISGVLALAAQIPAIASLAIALAVGEAFAAHYAWKRSRFFRLKFYNNYLEE